MIFGLVFCPLSHPKRNDIGGGTRCIYILSLKSRKMAANLAHVQAVFANLPRANGNFEVGIAVGQDPSLPDNQKLTLLSSNAQHELQRVVAINCAVNIFRERAPWVKDVTASAALAIVDCGLVGYRSDTDITLRVLEYPEFVIPVANRVADGDWSVIQTAPQRLEGEYVPNITEASMRNALSVVMVTKIMWYLNNHHLRGHVITGYLAKLIRAKYPDTAGNTAEWGDLAHVIGHWPGTIEILRRLEVPNIKHFVSHIANPPSILTIADALLRTRSTPAGTHRAAIAYAGVKRLAASSYAVFCPDVTSLANIKAVYDGITRDPAAHHIGSDYLCSRRAEGWSDMIANGWLGRIGTFLSVMFRNNTLLQSPHLTEAKIRSYDDYSPEWERVLMQIAASATLAQGRVMQEINEMAGRRNEDGAANLRNVFFA